MAAGSVDALAGSAGATTRVGVPVVVLSTRVSQEPSRVAGRPDALPSSPLQVWLAPVG